MKPFFVKKSENNKFFRSIDEMLLNVFLVPIFATAARVHFSRNGSSSGFHLKIRFWRRHDKNSNTSVFKKRYDSSDYNTSFFNVKGDSMTEVFVM